MLFKKNFSKFWCLSLDRKKNSVVILFGGKVNRNGKGKFTILRAEIIITFRIPNKKKIRLLRLNYV